MWHLLIEWFYAIYRLFLMTCRFQWKCWYYIHNVGSRQTLKPTMRVNFFGLSFTIRAHVYLLSRDVKNNNRTRLQQERDAKVIPMVIRYFIITVRTLSLSMASAAPRSCFRDRCSDECVREHDKNHSRPWIPWLYC